MVVCYFNVERITAAPFKTDSPLIINSDAVLSCSVAAEFFIGYARDFNVDVNAIK